MTVGFDVVIVLQSRTVERCSEADLVAVWLCRVELS